jgi:hypothetical protein
MRPAKLLKPSPQLLHILAIACRRLCHAATPPALDTPYQPSLNAVMHAYRKLTEQREKKKQSAFEYDPFSVNKNLID